MLAQINSLEPAQCAQALMKLILSIFAALCNEIHSWKIYIHLSSILQ